MKASTVFSIFLAAGLVLSFGSPTQARDIAAGAAKAKEVCAACHGVDGNNSDPSFPRLAGQYEDYLAKTLRDYKTGERNNAIMKGFAAALSERDIRNLAAFYASQRPALRVKY
ncbi:MAG: cytochrome c [Casimicrobiaceae bacterium]|nr:cytochrome c [Casimicrobiaceae bacterium]MCX8098392.1 cytochrome c [Casimicrobiaceae bacterium]MDW8312544.1 cytochrome c [Burkholderiales bacterium]